MNTQLEQDAQDARDAEEAASRQSADASAALRAACTHPHVLGCDAKPMEGRLGRLLRAKVAAAARICTTCGILESEDDTPKKGWRVLPEPTRVVTWDELVSTKTPGNRAVVHWCEPGEHAMLWPDDVPEYVDRVLTCQNDR